MCWGEGTRHNWTVFCSEVLHDWELKKNLKISQFPLTNLTEDFAEWWVFFMWLFSQAVAYCIRPMSRRHFTKLPITNWRQSIRPIIVCRCQSVDLSPPSWTLLYFSICSACKRDRIISFIFRSPDSVAPSSFSILQKSQSIFNQPQYSE
jgi:hypothetical protein